MKEKEAVKGSEAGNRDRPGHRDVPELDSILDEWRETQDKYRRIFENTGTAMMISEDDGTISIVNTEFERLTGYSREEVEGVKSWVEIIHMDDVDRIKESHRLGLIRFENNPSDTGPETYTYRLTTRCGEVRDVHATASLVPGSRQNIVSMMDITEFKRIHEAVRQSEKSLKLKSRELQELNTALNVLLKKREEDKKDLEQNVSSNVEKLILPYVLELKKHLSSRKALECIKLIEANLRDIASPLAQRLSSPSLNLTPKQVQIANLIKSGMTTKEIAGLLGISKSAVDTHRHNIRKRTGLNRTGANLRTYLSSSSS